MLQPSEENISAALELFEKILKNEYLKDYTKESLEEFIKKPEELRRLYLLFYQSYPRFEKEAHPAFGCGAYGLFDSVFKSGYWASLFEELELRKDGRVVDIGGPTKVFSYTLSLFGFKGSYRPVELSRKELIMRINTLKYLGLDFKPILADALHRTIKDNTCDLLVYNHVIDDMFRAKILRDYYNKRREGLPKFTEHPFQRLWEEAEMYKRRHMEEFYEEMFWWRLEKEIETKPHLKEFFYETLSLVENAVLDSCKILRKGGLVVFVQYPSSYDEKTPQISWSDVVLPKLVRMLLDSGMFSEAAKSDKNTFSHPWFVLRRK